MAVLDTKPIQAAELTEKINKGLEVHLNNLLADNVITAKVHKRLLDYKVVVHSKGFFSRLFSKYWAEEGDSGMRITSVKIINGKY